MPIENFSYELPAGEVFKDISNEQWREYVFVGIRVRILWPLRIHISKSGGHRIYDDDGCSHYIPPKWVHIRWKKKANEKDFVF